MSVEQTIDIESKILKYMRELIENIFESETNYKVIYRVGDYIAYQIHEGEYAAIDITDHVTPESKYTQVTTTPTFKNANELKIFLSNLMIDKYIMMKRDLEREAGMHEYGKPYL
ncbi:MAG TPA: hypothetical protein VFM18_13650 [Methanosarcina sp.]|nr:hypothetical protein [Methanosarcina sp.]